MKLPVISDSRINKIFNLLLWGIPITWLLCVLLPVIFGGVLGGQIGDSFGAANSLFAGMGFLGLAYTLLLQMSSNKSQSDRDKFLFIYGLLTELKRDYENTQVINMLGVAGVKHIAKSIEMNPDTVRQFEAAFTYLFTCNLLLADCIKLISKHRDKIDGEDIDILKVRVTIIHLNYCEQFLGFILPHDKESSYFHFLAQLRELEKMMNSKFMYEEHNTIHNDDLYTPYSSLLQFKKDLK